MIAYKPTSKHDPASFYINCSWFWFVSNHEYSEITKLIAAFRNFWKKALKNSHSAFTHLIFWLTDCPDLLSRSLRPHTWLRSHSLSPSCLAQTSTLKKKQQDVKHTAGCNTWLPCHWFLVNTKILQPNSNCVSSCIFTSKTSWQIIWTNYEMRHNSIQVSCTGCTNPTLQNFVVAPNISSIIIAVVSLTNKNVYQFTCTEWKEPDNRQFVPIAAIKTYRESGNITEFTFQY
jgi:hypothetical protein